MLALANQKIGHEARDYFRSRTGVDFYFGSITRLVGRARVVPPPFPRFVSSLSSIAMFVLAPLWCGRTRTGINLVIVHRSKLSEPDQRV
ncbi:hypothetical protein LI328DRAFT_139188 [Trichoderma asperelloides]|nr:hypothetical protein LI328DRAFT_139188 [Trichoderma asperelloides]